MADAPRRFPPPWRADKIPGGGYVVQDANGQKLAYIYSRPTLVEAMQAKVLTADEARRIAVILRQAQDRAAAGAAREGGLRQDRHFPCWERLSHLDRWAFNRKKRLI